MICGIQVYCLIEITNLLMGALLLALAKSIYYSEVLVAFYFQAHLPDRIPLFFYLLVHRHYNWACFPFL